MGWFVKCFKCRKRVFRDENGSLISLFIVFCEMVLVYVIGDEWYGINLVFWIIISGECWVEIKIMCFIIYMLGVIELYCYDNELDDLFDSEDKE